MVESFVLRLQMHGASSGPLHGLKFAVKNTFDVAGTVTGAGHPLWAASHPPVEKNAPVIQTLLDAGALLVGKTITTEFAYSLTGINPHYGTPLNPAAPDCLPGGSSAGSASAVASGEVDFALGSDTGGSVRIPASYCGIFGLHPSRGAISTDGLLPLAPTLDTVGWFARSIDMLQRVGDVLLPRLAAMPLGRLLVAQDLLETADPACRDAFPILGPPVMIAPEGSDHWLWVFTHLQGFEAWQIFGEWIERERPTLESGVQAAFELAASVTEAEYRRACKQRNLLKDRLNKLLGDSTVLCFPTAVAGAPARTASPEELAERRRRELVRCAYAGLAGLPQINIPLSNVDHRPVGLSLAGPRGSDRELIRFAASLS